MLASCFPPQWTLRDAGGNRGVHVLAGARHTSMQVPIAIVRRAEGVGVDPGDIAARRNTGDVHHGPWFTNAAGEVSMCTNTRHPVESWDTQGGLCLGFQESRSPEVLGT